jgi:hypothetical protein
MKPEIAHARPTVPTKKLTETAPFKNIDESYVAASWS